MGAGEVGTRSGGPPHPAQRLPANQRANESRRVSSTTSRVSLGVLVVLVLGRAAGVVVRTGPCGFPLSIFEHVGDLIGQRFVQLVLDEVREWERPRGVAFVSGDPDVWDP
jgi:hypothetical protein